MDKKVSNEFEHFMGKTLQNTGDAPDPGTWEQIAARQGRRNIWLRTKYTAAYAAPLLVAVALIAAGFWFRQSVMPAPRLPQAQQLITAPEMVQHKPGQNIQPLATKTAERPGGVQAAGHFARFKGWPSWNANNTVPVETRCFRAEEGVFYTSPVSGNTVAIPPNALLLPDGSRAQGEVELLFREYRSMADYLASGMPMHYSDERGEFFFNSGGMFELRVAQHGEALQLAPGKACEIGFAPAANLSRTNLYYLDDRTDDWAYVPGQSFDGKAVKTSAKLPPVVTEADVVRENTRNSMPQCIPGMTAFPVDENPVQWVKDAVRLGKALAYRQIKVPEWYRKNPDRDDKFFLDGFERSDIRIVDRPDGDDRYFFPEDRNGFFTELKVLQDCYFTKAIDTSQNKFRSQENRSVDNIFLKKRYWQRISIVPDWGANCTILLGDGEEQIVIEARLCQGNEHVVPGKPFDAAALLREYQKQRQARLSKLAAELAGWRHFFGLTRMFQPEQEWCMESGQWLDYFERNLPLMQQRYGALVHAGLSTDDTAAQKALDDWRARLRALNLEKLKERQLRMKRENLLTTILQITGFGVYNCDQIFRLGEGALMVEAEYKTPDGQSIRPAAVRMIRRDSRIFFSISQTGRVYKFPGKNVDLLVTDGNGRTFHLPAERYAATDFGSRTRVEFVLDDVSLKTRTPEDWAELLEI